MKTAVLLEEILRGWLKTVAQPERSAAESRLRAAAMASFGTLAGGDPDRSTNTRGKLTSTRGPGRS